MSDELLEDAHREEVARRAEAAAAYDELARVAARVAEEYRARVPDPGVDHVIGAAHRADIATDYHDRAEGALDALVWGYPAQFDDEITPPLGS